MSEVELIGLLVLVSGYLLTFFLSGIIVRFVLALSNPIADSSDKAPSEEAGGLGAIIGKCENFLTITLIITDNITGLGLILTAKSILRARDMKNRPRYFLGGTLVNLCFSVLMGFLLRFLLGKLGLC